MKKVDDYEEIRRAYNLEHKSIRAIHRQMGYDRETIRKAIVNPAPDPYRLKKPREARVIGPYQQRITELLDQSEKQRRKQRYTAHRIYEILHGAKAMQAAKVRFTTMSVNNARSANTGKPIFHWNLILGQMRRWIGVRRKSN